MSDPERVWIQFVLAIDAATPEYGAWRIRKWQRSPFDGGVEYALSVPAPVEAETADWVPKEMFDGYREGSTSQFVADADEITRLLLENQTAMSEIAKLLVENERLHERCNIANYRADNLHADLEKATEAMWQALGTLKALDVEQGHAAVAIRRALKLEERG